MTKPIRWRFAASLLLAGLLGLPGPLRAQTLELGVDGSPAGLDPHIVTAFNSFAIVNGTVYEGLTAIDPRLRIVPGLAASWTISADARTYRFTLRPGARFHDAAPLSAEDVVASLERVRGTAIASPLASRLAALDTATAIDPGTVELRLKEPSAPLLASLAGIAIVPARFATDKDSLQRAPMGTGPFRFAEWQPNAFIRLVRHDGYGVPGVPAVEGVRFSILPESATRQLGLASGQFAMLPNLDAVTALQLKGRPGIRLQETLELAYTLIGMNTGKPPFDNPKVREALNLSLDRSEIVQAALFGAGVPGGPLSPALTDWAVDVASFPCYRTDRARARALLAEAGHASPLKVTMTVLPRQDIRDIAVVVQAQLNQAGFEVELKSPELGAFIQEWRNSAFELFASTNAGSVDPDDYFFRAFRTGGSTNVFKYSNPALDSLLDRARAETDQAARRALYAEVQAILACQGPVAHLAYGQLFTATGPFVQGFEMIANRSLSGLARTTLGR